MCSPADVARNLPSATESGATAGEPPAARSQRTSQGVTQGPARTGRAARGLHWLHGLGGLLRPRCRGQGPGAALSRAAWKRLGGGLRELGRRPRQGPKDPHLETFPRTRTLRSVPGRHLLSHLPSPASSLCQKGRPGAQGHHLRGGESVPWGPAAPCSLGL